MKHIGLIFELHLFICWLCISVYAGSALVESTFVESAASAFVESTSTAFVEAAFVKTWFAAWFALTLGTLIRNMTLNGMEQTK